MSLTLSFQFGHTGLVLNFDVSHANLVFSFHFRGLSLTSLKLNFHLPQLKLNSHGLSKAIIHLVAGDQLVVGVQLVAVGV